MPTHYATSGIIGHPARHIGPIPTDFPWHLHPPTSSPQREHKSPLLTAPHHHYPDINLLRTLAEAPGPIRGAICECPRFCGLPAHARALTADSRSLRPRALVPSPTAGPSLGTGGRLDRAPRSPT
jgi:hypothetical protein